ncbi:MAG: hypothetical protein IKN17_12360 [Ruminococcus sp.]|nr:hypothetical protein [Ruminococcus sp.]
MKHRTRRFAGILTAVALAVGQLPAVGGIITGSAATIDLKGRGTCNSPFLVSSAEDLKLISSLVKQG